MFPTSHRCPAVTIALDALTAELGPPVEYSESLEQWTWGEVEGVYAKRGVELRYNWRDEGAKIGIVYGGALGERSIVVIDEAAPAIDPVSLCELAHDALGLALTQAPLASAVAAAKALLNPGLPAPV